jgi:hypothetical protein
MTVSLVLFDGRRAADRTHHKILKELYPHLAHDLKALGSKKLHFITSSSRLTQFAVCN